MLSPHFQKVICAHGCSCRCCVAMLLQCCFNVVGIAMQCNDAMVLLQCFCKKFCKKSASCVCRCRCHCRCCYCCCFCCCCFCCCFCFVFAFVVSAVVVFVVVV